MKATLFVMCVVLGACSYNTGNPPKQQPDPEPKTTHGPLGLTPQDDIELVVSSGWHDGKTYNLQQHLKANTITKRSLNAGE
jgi:hypothetical protein